MLYLNDDIILQPALPEPAIALALPLVERQLQQFGSQLPLATAILHFLSRLAATSKACVMGEGPAGGGGGEGGEGEEGGGEIYSTEQVGR